MQLKLIVLIQLKYILRKPELEENKRKPFAEELDKYGWTNSLNKNKCYLVK